VLHGGRLFSLGSFTLTHPGFLMLFTRSIKIFSSGGFNIILVSHVGSLSLRVFLGLD